MTLIPHKFTFKIIISYLVLLIMAVAVSYFLYSEFRGYTNSSMEESVENKFIETGTLVNLVYETDSFSRLALLTGKESDFRSYGERSDSLFLKIEEIKKMTEGVDQERRLDSVEELLRLKNKNIEQLRILKITSSKDNSLNEILDEFKKLEVSMGKNSLETLLREPAKLSDRQRTIWQSYADWLNTTTLTDTTKLDVVTVDSMLIASRFIVSEAKKENSRINRSLKQKESDLIINDLTISAQLREIIGAFDAELTKSINLEKTSNEAKVARTRLFLRYAAIAGAIVMLLFVYIILNDFFKAERFKKSLEKSKVVTEDLLKSREQLVSTVSHDLKTPLNTIVGYSELIENTNLNERQHYYINQITSSASFVTKLVDDLLDYSKLDAGQLPLEHISFSLNTIIVQVVKSLKDTQTPKNVSLTIHIHDRLKDAVFRSDPFRIQQIIYNLVGNAYKFTNSGSIHVSANVQKTSKQDMTVAIEIKDTGIGIAKEKRAAIFNEFVQANTDITHKFGGSGLGLAISRKLARLLGGDITVESTLGEGSAFTLVLPLEKAGQRILDKEGPQVLGFSRLSVVVFDDNPTMLAMLSELFEQLGVDCHSYGSFTEFEKSPPSQFDVVLTDIQMPEVSGFEVLSKMRDSEGDGKEYIPIIAMTGSNEHSQEHYLQKGFDKLILKPFSKGILLQTLQELFPDAIIEREEVHATSKIKENDLFDLSLLRSFVANEISMREILEDFYQETENDLASMNEKFVAGSYSEIGEISHKMLTMSRQLRAKNVIPILETLEDLNYETYSKDALHALWLNLKREVNSLLISLKETTA